MTYSNTQAPVPVNNILLSLNLTSAVTLHHVTVVSVQLNQIGARFVVTTHFNGDVTVITDTDNRIHADNAFKEYAKCLGEMSS